MKTITAYQAEDGKVFQTKEECEAHEARLDFLVYYERNQLYGIYEGSRVEFTVLEEWLKEHRAVLLPYLNSM